MSWFTENKLFSSLLVIIVLAAGALGYLLFDARSHYSASLEAYQTAVQQVTGLRALSPFRNEANLKKIQAQVVSYKDLTNKLHDELIHRQGEIAPMDPAAFQVRLRESVSKIVANAALKKVVLPEKFYLGFDRYQSELPRNDIAGLLSWQLDAVEAVVNRLIEYRVSSIVNVIRVPLPGESAVEAPSKEVPLLKKYPFEIVFVGYPRDAKAILNELVATPEFMVVRAVRVENEALKAPPKALDAASAPPSDGQTSAAPALNRIIIGKEKITTSLVIDLVQFTPQPAPKK